MKHAQGVSLGIALIALTLAISITGSPTSAQDTPLLEPPNAPRNVVVNPAVNSLNVFWDAPIVDGNNAPTGYIVRWDPGTQTGPTTFTSQGIPNLIGGQTYSVTIVAFNDEGRSISKPVEATPLIGADVTTIQVEEDSITDTAAEATITLANPNSESVTVNLRYRTPPNTGNWTAAPAIATSGTTATASLTGLNADTRYEAQASLDSSFFHYVAVDRFETDGPPRQPFLSLVPQDGTLTAQWTFESNGGAVTSYLLEWKLSTEASFTDTAAPAPTATSHEITGLDNGLAYTARLTVNTDYGSATSEDVTVSPGIEPVVLSVEFNRVLANFEIDGVESDFTALKFRLANLETAGQTTLVHSRIWEDGHSDRTQEPITQFSPESPNVTYDQYYFLPFGVEHRFHYVVVIPGSEADWSKAAQLQFKTPVGVPHWPAGFALTPDDGTITVSWEPPLRDGGSPVTGYSVRWRPAHQTESIGSWSAPSHARSYRITGLTNGVPYTVEVAARNDFGVGRPLSEDATPSTVPQSEPLGVVASGGCDSGTTIGWMRNLDSGGTSLSTFLVQWKSSDQVAYSAENQKDEKRFVFTNLGGLENGTEYTVRVRAVNANGPAARLVTDPETMTTTTVPIWSEEVTVIPHVGLCLIGVRFGNALGYSVPIIVDLDPSGASRILHVRYREWTSSVWIKQSQQTVDADARSVAFDLRRLKPGAAYSLEFSDNKDFPRNNTFRWAYLHTSQALDGSAGDPESIARILRVEPSIKSINVGSGETVRLSVEIYGRQDIHDNGIADRAPSEGRPAFNWIAPGISISEADIRSDWRNGIADDRAVKITAPENPGTYMITVQPVGSNTCLGRRDGETEQDRIARCSAAFQLTVRRSSAVELETSAPVNPPGSIPETLTDSEGTAYAVFTPVDGGVFQGDGVELVAGSGAVNSGEFIGISIVADGDASNVGQTHHRFSLAGSRYAVQAVDADGGTIGSYVLGEPATICLPLPDQLRSNIDDLAILATNDAEALQVLSTAVRITPTGAVVCGTVSQLPLTVAVGALGAPDPIPEESAVPDGAGQLPDTGGAAPTTSLMLFLLLLGVSITFLSLRGPLRRFVVRRGNDRSELLKPATNPDLESVE